MDTDLHHPTQAAVRRPVRGRVHKRSPRLAILLLALERAERRLYEVIKNDASLSAELISLFVADIARMRREEQELRDRQRRRWRFPRRPASTHR